MREWNLTNGDPLSLIVAADARIDPVDYPNDHIWEVVIGRGEPLALSIETTFGLRARLMRIFPIFTLANTTRIDPASFFQPVRVSCFYPDFLRLVYSPFSGLDVICEYWVPSSQVLACQTRITNSSVIPAHLQLEWAALLAPLGEGVPMSYALDQKATILQGRTAGLEPVFYSSGNPGASSGPFPTLVNFLELAPGNVQVITWALASLADQQSSINLAGLTLARPWETEIARLDMFNAAQSVEIETGDPDWDAAFALSQKNAHSFIMGPAQGLPHASFVLSRQPDNGYSDRGDGSDFGYLWAGQSPIDAYYLASLILPGGAQIVQNIVRNFLSTQSQDGQIDGKPGLAGQRGHFLAAPLLAALTWKAFQCSRDDNFLAEVFPGLTRYVEAWFLPAHDRDGDGFPEWDHPIHSGFEENPIFNRGQSKAPANDISTFETPSLAACLYNEIQSLKRIARQLNLASSIHTLTARAEVLRKAVESTWDTSRIIYHYRDRDTHLSNTGGPLTESIGPGEIIIARSFKKPCRLLVYLLTHTESNSSATVIIHGVTPIGACIEEIPARSFMGASNQASLSTRNVFTSLERIEIMGVSPDDQVSIFTIDYSQEDITLLLPLWAQIPHPRRSESLVKKTILNPDRFLLPFGLTACPVKKGKTNDDPDPGNESCPQIYMIWNQLIAEGLLSYGYRAEAAGLFSRLMTAVITTLKARQGFYHLYDGQTGEASGKRNLLDGLAPTGLFLDILGVQLMSPNSVIIHGINPFSWPVTVKYRGLTVIRREKQTQVIFPDGQTVNVAGTGKQWVSLTTDKL
jgi:hypothetical protein